MIVYGVPFVSKLHFKSMFVNGSMFAVRYGESRGRKSMF